MMEISTPMEKLPKKNKGLRLLEHRVLFQVEKRLHLISLMIE